MKKPKLEAIPPADPATFTEQARKAKPATTSPAAVPDKTGDAAKRRTMAVKRTFTMTEDDAAYLDALALELGTARGKSMSASETIRHIIDDHRSAAKPAKGGKVRS